MATWPGFGGGGGRVAAAAQESTVDTAVERNPL